jgi:hypothetical protein
VAFAQAGPIQEDTRLAQHLRATAQHESVVVGRQRGQPESSDARFDGLRDASRFKRLLERLDNDQVELSYCGYLIDHDLCPRRLVSDAPCPCDDGLLIDVPDAGKACR